MREVLPHNIISFILLVNELRGNNKFLLISIINIHGWSLWNENYLEQTSKMNSLIVDFETEAAKASLAFLNLTEWFNEMKNAQIEFEKAFQDKASADI